MSKRILGVLMVGTIAIFLLACVAAEQQVKELSADEKEIFQLFADMEAAWNQQDGATYITFWHEDLKLKLGSKSDPKIYSRSEYEQILPQRMADFGPFKMVKPEVLESNGEKAKAKVIVKKAKRSYPNTFNLVHVNGSWQIISNEW